MAESNDSFELLQILNRLSSNYSKENTCVFKDKYKISYSNCWKPWPSAPLNLTQNCFVICYNKEEIKNVFNESMESHQYGYSENFSSDELTGNPLEYTQDFSFEETPLFTPNITSSENNLSLADARYICDLALEAENSIKKTAFYILCNGKDRGKTILLGKSKNMRISGFSKGIIGNRDQYPKLHEFRDEHYSGFTPSFSSQVVENVYAYFVILGSPLAMDYKMLKSSGDAFLALECSDSSISQILQISSLNSTCNMLLKVAANEECKLDVSRFKELRFLQALFDCLKTCEMVWPAQGVNAVEKLHDFFQGLKNNNVNATQEKSICFNINVESPFYFNADRKDMDFTDHLWYILMDCSSYSELTSCLNVTFEELNNMSFTPFVHKNNKTTIAQLAQKNFILLPNMQSTRPIELLLEIGIEKLCKDYVSLLVGCEMVPYDVLLPFLELCKDFDGALKCLEKLHMIMEMVLMVSSHLMLQKIELSQFVQTALNWCESSSVDSTCIFKFPLCMNNVKDILTKTNPSVWWASIKNSKDGYEKQSFLIFSSMCDTLEYSHMSGTHLGISNFPYHITKYTVIHDTTF